MRGRSASPGDPGFALPLAVGVLVAVTLAVALILDGAVAAVRSSRADLELARAEAAAESALTDALALRLDTAALRAAPGTALSLGTTVGRGDSVTTTIQTVSGRIARVVVYVRRTAAGLRLSVGRIAFARIVPDSTTPGDARISPLRDAWWAPFP